MSQIPAFDYGHRRASDLVKPAEWRMQVIQDALLDKHKLKEVRPHDYKGGHDRVPDLR